MRNKVQRTALFAVVLIGWVAFIASGFRLWIAIATLFLAGVVAWLYRNAIG
jgi:hypothetical protein